MYIEGSYRHSSHRTARTWKVFTAKLIDLCVIFGGLFVVVWLLRPGAWDIKYIFTGLTASLLFFLFAEMSGCYRFQVGEPFVRKLLRITGLWAGILIVLLVVGYLFKQTAGLSRISITTWAVLTPLLLAIWRNIAQRLLVKLNSRAGYVKGAVVWGTGDLAENVVSAIKSADSQGVRLIDYVEENSWLHDPDPLERADLKSRLRDLAARVDQQDVDILYIAMPSHAREHIVDLLDLLANTTATVYMVPDYFTTELFHGRWASLNGIPVISVFDTPFWGVEGWLKRAQDVVVASLILLLIAIPMLIIALGIKLTSPGPVFFRQRRYGMDGKEIRVWKFRSMTTADDGDNVPQATRDDARITPFGAFLRKTSLDELPQFFNVLKGDMSIVGPRPHAVAHNEEYRRRIKGYMLRHKVKPGITGWAQINGWRGETDELYKMEKRVEHDLWYIRNWSVWLDLKIILLTAWREFGSKNAY